jgi:hypothetical protein
VVKTVGSRWVFIVRERGIVVTLDGDLRREDGAENQKKDNHKANNGHAVAHQAPDCIDPR